MSPLSSNQAVLNTEALIAQLKNDLKESLSIDNESIRSDKLKEIVKSYVSIHELDGAFEAAKFIPIENVRNLVIADLIEEYLLPTHDILRAKEYVKFLTPGHETTSLVLINIALVENHPEEALEYVNDLPTPLSRNYALWHIANLYILNADKQNLFEIGDMMVENARLMPDVNQQCYALRDVAKNLFLAHHDKERARKAAELIHDPILKTRLLQIIEYT